MSSLERPPRGNASPHTDCATCRRRRIKCDRGSGGCHKCKKKGFDCPGYGPRVQWINDVATRGRLKGLQAAFLEQHNHSELRRPAPACSVDDLGDAGVNAESMTLRNIHGQDSSSDLAPEVQHADWDKLSSYYRDHVAPLMVWIDSKENPYQTHVVSLASTSHVLRLAISAISALHWNATRRAEQLALPEDFRDEAVLGITASVRTIIDSTTELDLGMAQWMLASMMVLSCCEMIKVGAMEADWHRRAARALVNVIKTMAWCDDALLVFLMNQLAAYDILSCTTSFDLDDVEAGILATTQANGPLFSRILNLIHEITLQSRRNTLAPDGQGSSAEDGRCGKQALSRLRHEIEIARGDTLMAAASASFDSEAQRRDFVRLVDLHCKATLMYAHRAYRYGDVAGDPHSVDDFFSMLSTIEQPERSRQNLSWPLFIAGTEIRGDPEKQRQVVDIFNDIHRLMGFDHFQELVEFLASVWNGPNSDWLSCAQEWESQGKRILAV